MGMEDECIGRSGSVTRSANFNDNEGRMELMKYRGKDWGEVKLGGTVTNDERK